ncbi:MAG: adenylate/guanylate cyclase domain-containing protein [Verrucomicrobiales bacterium]
MVDFTELASSRIPKPWWGCSIWSSPSGHAGPEAVEKIKTIGDAYIAAKAGLPVPRPDHAESIARFAIDLFTEIESIQEMVEGPINLRVGIDSGPVIAGIIEQANSRMTFGATPSTLPAEWNPTDWLEKSRSVKTLGTSSKTNSLSLSGVKSKSKGRGVCDPGFSNREPLRT